MSRRRFPRAAAGDLHPVDAAAELWRGRAFERPLRAEGLGTRLERFESHYGEDVLAAARAGEESEAARILAGWIAANPPRPGDVWHPYALSTRVGNWIAAVTLVPSLASRDLSESLRRQLAYLERNIEDDVLGNHVIRNARALVLGGAAFGDERLLARGRALLDRELPEQILPDGGHYERSPAYHLLVMRDLLEVQAVAAGLDEVLARMDRFGRALLRPDGAPAHFNDGGVDVAPDLGLAPADEGLHVFPETGYVVWRGPRLWLAFDCGPPAPDFLPAHAHADALSFQLWWDGRPVFVDAGTYTYEPGPERDWFRSTAAHSTIRIDGHDQFEQWGAFRTGPLPRVELLDAREGEVAGHTGVHSRRIRWSEREVTIEDRIDGRSRHRIESRLVRSPRFPSRIHVDALTVEEIEMESGWVSDRFGEREPTTVDLVRAEFDLPANLGWRVTVDE